MDYFCSDCGEDISEKVYDYSKKNYGKTLCRDCQSNFKTNKKIKKIIKKEIKKEDNEGLSRKDSYFTESMIKGRIAETLIEELFLKLKYNVFRYGMENTVPGIMNLLKGIRGDVANDIRRMPDFVVQNPKTNKVYFVEIKFRKSGVFDKTEKCLKNYPYTNAYFVVVSKKHIKCITYDELINQNKEVTPTSKNYLGNRKEFELDKNVIIDFCKFAVKFFKNV